MCRCGVCALGGCRRWISAGDERTQWRHWRSGRVFASEGFAGDGDVVAFLGNALVSVRYGKEKARIAAGGRIETDPSTTIAMMMENVSTASSEARDMFKSFNGNQGDILKKLREVIDENREDMRNASKSLSEAGPQLKELSSRLNELTADVQAGKGTMGKLFKDEELYNSVKTFTADAKEITNNQGWEWDTEPFDL